MNSDYQYHIADSETCSAANMLPAMFQVALHTMRLMHLSLHPLTASCFCDAPLTSSHLSQEAGSIDSFLPAKLLSAHPPYCPRCCSFYCSFILCKAYLCSTHPATTLCFPLLMARASLASRIVVTSTPWSGSPDTPQAQAAKLPSRQLPTGGMTALHLS